jgi:hypothetical protein
VTAVLLVAASPARADPTSVSVGDAGPVTEGQNAVFRLSLDSAATSDVSLGFNFGGTAEASDFTGTSPSTVLIPRGQTFVDVTVPTTADTVDENDESLTLNLQTSPVALADVSGTAIIVDDDTASVTVGDVSQPEGTGVGSTRLTFEITMSGTSSTAVSVGWQTVPGTAVSPADFSSGGGTVQWPAGRSGARAVMVEIARDSSAEPDETLTVTLSGLAGIAVVADGTASGIIVDDDTPAGQNVSAATLTIGDAVVNEGTASVVLSVTLGGSAAQTVSVQFEGQSGAGPRPPATLGTDFSLPPGTLTFALGQTTQTITVAITQDAVAEADETFQVVLGGQTPAGVTIARGTATVTIVDNDTAVSPRVIPPALPVVIPSTRPVTVPAAPIGPKPIARKKLTARLLSTRLIGKLDGRSRAAIRVTLNQRVSARLVFVQGRRVIRSAPFVLTAGNRTVVVLFPGDAKSGRVDLRLQLTTANSGKKVLKTKLVLEA